MASPPSLTAVVALLLLVISVSISTAQAQTTQNCASKLIPCAQYLNATTKPPNSCCDPIKEAVATDLQCLCNLYENPSFLTGLGINVAQALNLPRLCDIPADVSACKTSAPAPSGSSTRPPPGSTPGGNGAAKIASSGVVGLFLLISASMMLF